MLGARMYVCVDGVNAVFVEYNGICWNCSAIYSDKNKLVQSENTEKWKKRNLILYSSSLRYTNLFVNTCSSFVALMCALCSQKLVNIFPENESEMISRVAPCMVWFCIQNHVRYRIRTARVYLNKCKQTGTAHVQIV